MGVPLPIKPKGWLTLIALVDWFSCSFSGQKNLHDIFLFFGLSRDDFVPCTRNGKLHYEAGYWYGGITIYYNRKEDRYGVFYDVLVQMSGKGCRSYETLQGDGFDWVPLFDRIQHDYPESAHFSRLDVAVDVKDKTVPTMKSIIRQTAAHKYISLMRRVLPAAGTDEEWVYFGSPHSDTRLRIYNKALERGQPGKWVRFECQLRNDSAKRFLYHLKNGVSGRLGDCYRDFMNSIVRYTQKPNRPSNGYSYNTKSSRLDIARWWQRFTEEAGKLVRLEPVGVDYNFENLSETLERQAGNMLAAYIDGYDGDIQPLLDMIDRHKESQSERQRQAVREHQAQQRLKQMRSDLFG